MSRNWLICTLATLLVSAAAAGTPAAGTPAAEPDTSAPSTGVQSRVPFAWEHQHTRFSYVGFTVRYSCDGLEDQVRRILVYVGARKDARVTATGCPFASTAPARTAWVDADFDVPVPAPATDASTVTNAAAPGAAAQWRDVKLTPRQPEFLTPGDCELIESMKDVFTKTLHLRDVKFRTSCFPGSLSEDGFEVSGQTLKISDPKNADAR